MLTLAESTSVAKPRVFTDAQCYLAKVSKKECPSIPKMDGCSLPKDRYISFDKLELVHMCSDIFELFI